MKFIPLNNQPNISLSRLESISPSLKMANNAFPNVSWLNKKDGFNEVNYSYWDGSTWAFNGDTPSVYRSKENIVCFSNSLVLKNQLPVIAFARRSALGSRLSVATYSDQWDFNTLNVNYSAEWIGIINWDRDIDHSSSSSSSSVDSSSSSSTNMSESSESSSSYSSLSSSSSSSYNYSESISSVSTNSSSSSSIDSSSSSLSSSSSSENDATLFVVVYDATNYLFKIYAVSGIWTLIGTISDTNITALSYSNIRIYICGRRIGIAYFNSSGDSGSSSSESSASSESHSSSSSSSAGDYKMWYNFFDLYTETWFNASFQPVTNSLSDTEIIDMDMAGYHNEDVEVMALGWLVKNPTTFVTKSVLIDNSGTETASDGVNVVVESNAISVYSSQDYIINGYRKIAICIDDDNLPQIIATGAVSRAFYMVGVRAWITDNSNIEAVSNGSVCGYIRASYGNVVSVAMSFDSGDIYYFISTSTPEFVMTTPQMSVISNNGVSNVTYSSGELIPTDIAGVDNSYCASILGESKSPVLVVTER